MLAIRNISLKVRWAVVLGLSLVGLAWTATVGTHEKFPASMNGVFRFSGGEPELQALRDELDRVANKFNFIVREIARGKLHSRIRPYMQIEFDRTGDGVARIHLGDRAPLLCDGVRHTVRSSDEESGKAKCSYARGQVTVDAIYPDAVNLSTFTLSEDDKVLRMHVTLKAKKLPDTVRYALSYRRK